MGKELAQVPQVRTLKWSLIRFINEKIGVVLSLPPWWSEARKGGDRRGQVEPSSKRKPGSPKQGPGPRSCLPSGLHPWSLPFPHQGMQAEKEGDWPVQFWALQRRVFQSFTVGADNGGIGILSFPLVVSRDALLAKWLRPSVLPSVKGGYWSRRVAGPDGMRIKREASRGKIICARLFPKKFRPPPLQDLSQRGVWKFNRASQSGS